MAVNRRIGAESSTNRAALMDGVEAVMREDGYAALTARRVAARAGLRHQLVFYYFESMDDLLLATCRRHIERYRETMEHALRSEQPLHAFWRVNSNPHDGVLNAEFLAIANHNETIRAETVRFGEEFRKVGVSHIVPQGQAATKAKDPLSPAAIIMVINSVGSLLGLESAIGISGAHSEIALVEWCADELEPPFV
jgi:AcrR family transcriptional regulator